MTLTDDLINIAMLCAVMLGGVFVLLAVLSCFIELMED